MGPVCWVGSSQAGLCRAFGQAGTNILVWGTRAGGWSCCRAWHTDQPSKARGLAAGPERPTLPFAWLPAPTPRGQRQGWTSGAAAETRPLLPSWVWRGASLQAP